MAEREGFEPSVGLTEDADGYDPNVVWETLPSSIASRKFGIMSPELRHLVRSWANLDRDTRLVILGLSRPWRGDGA
jgi:hypothetical protein